MYKLTPTTLLFLLTSAASMTALAQSESDRSDGRVEFRIGGQAFSNFSTQLRVDSDTLGLGTELELESALAVDESINVGRLDALIRLNQRHGLAASYYDIERDGSRAITQDINFGDAFYPVGTPVRSEFNQKIIKLAYRYRFLIKPKAELSGSFGLHTMQINTALRALDGSIVQEQDADAPLPVIGLQGTYDFADRWRLNGMVEWFDIQAGDLQGKFLDALVAVEHKTFENGGFGIGYNRLSLSFKAGDENLRGRLKLSFNAALIYFNGRFGSL